MNIYNAFINYANRTTEKTIEYIIFFRNGDMPSSEYLNVSLLASFNSSGLAGTEKW